LPPGAAGLSVADRRIGLAVNDADLQTTLRDWLAPAAGTGEVDHLLRLMGTADDWHLQLDGTRRTLGTSADGALVATLSALTELGCRPAERLLVIHGAGLVQPDGRGLLLVAPGGSGKSTLAAALDAAGFGLLSDDVVPVTLDGDLLGLGLPLCLKAGSWPVLAARRPELAQARTVQRLGQPVRYLPPCTPAPAGPVTPACVLLSRYQPGRAPTLRPVAPDDLLAGLLAAEAVIRDLTQAKLEALARWVQAVPAWELTYPDLDRALALIADLTGAGGRP
jgi:hypothetical protein